MAEQLVEHYASPKEDGFLQKLVALSMEINNLKEIQDMIFQTFFDYRALERREIRSLLPVKQ
ncbi:hypothetical protein ACF0H5_007680 [Mactra antiquata]